MQGTTLMETELAVNGSSVSIERSGMKRSFRSRTNFVIENLRDMSHPREILDIGFIGERSRPFIHEAILADLREDDRLVGIDIKDVTLSFPPHPKASYRKASIFDIDSEEEYRGRFDAAVLCEVFEHLPHPYLALHKIHYALKPGGMIVLTYPNPLSWKPIIRYLIQHDITDPKFIQRYVGESDHKVLPMPACLLKYIGDLGFTDARVGYLKGLGTTIPILNKFSTYIGIAARKN